MSAAERGAKDGHVLSINGLCASAGGEEILRGVDLEVRSGKVHVVMGPNGSGKSTLAHVIMGKPGYEVTAGTVTLDGVDMLALSPWERAQAGLFLSMQHPPEVAGVSLAGVLASARAYLQAGQPRLEQAQATRRIEPSAEVTQAVTQQLQAEAEVIGLRADLLDRPLNVDLSGGERKRAETCQLAVINPAIAVLDELDSGLDVDALRACAERIEQMTETGLGVLAITHFHRLLRYLRPDEIHVIVDGRIVDSGGPELANRLEAEGYARYAAAEPEAGVEVQIGGLGGAGLSDLGIPSRSLEEELGL